MKSDKTKGSAFSSADITKFIRSMLFGDKLSSVFTIIAAIFLLYYLTVGIFVGFNISILFVWPFFSLCIIGYLFIRKLSKEKIIKIPKPLIIIFGIFICICFAIFFTVECMIFDGFVSDAPKSCDYIIVLGARVSETKPSLALKYRIDAAYEYLSENPDTICIATGAKGDDEIISEASCIKNELVKSGIDSDRIITEEKSLSTSENIYNSFEIIRDTNAKVAIVSSNFHVTRGKAIARKCGLKEVYGISAPLPSILLPHYLVREFVSIVVDTAYGNTKFI